MLILIKNVDTVTHTWNGQEILSDATYELQEQERERWARNDEFLIDLANGLAEISYLGTVITSYDDALDILRNELPTEVIPKTPKNEHTMQPCGCAKGYFESKGNATTGDYICAITLTNKSQDGLTFTYNSDMPIVPTIGNYVFQNENTKRTWATAVDTVNHTITFEQPVLDNGTCIYTKGMWVDCVIPDWGASSMYLWGVTLTIIEKDAEGVIETSPCEDLIELSVVDEYDLFKTDQVCQALFGVDAVDAGPYLTALGFEINGEYANHWTKYYDESWVLNINGVYTHTPDGSPGNILTGLVLRVSLFTTENVTHKYHIFKDYYLTVKDQ